MLKKASFMAGDSEDLCRILRARRTRNQEIDLFSFFPCLKAFTMIIDDTLVDNMMDGEERPTRRIALSWPLVVAVDLAASGVFFDDVLEELKSFDAALPVVQLSKLQRGGVEMKI